MSIKEIASFLGFKKQKIYRLITSKKLIGKLSRKGCYEITAENFESFMGQLNSPKYDSCQLSCLINLSS